MGTPCPAGLSDLILLAILQERVLNAATFISLERGNIYQLWTRQHLSVLNAARVFSCERGNIYQLWTRQHLSVVNAATFISFKRVSISILKAVTFISSFLFRVSQQGNSLVALERMFQFCVSRKSGKTYKNVCVEFDICDADSDFRICESK